ncbi:ras-responsive element-binding protein 1 isoform X2 [Prorops nasuta]|uniref:ras-responsive element-binding protein 1 isoform X2 n=1 Tax=Prorops nasuta TaxID=863751 RepID=UPI0034CE77CF
MAVKSETIEDDKEQPQVHVSSQSIAEAAAAADLSEESHTCPLCAAKLPSVRELTHHLRAHNSPRSTDCSGEDDYICGVCQKALSSASSLDRHVLVHSGERPFKCKYCEMAFTTNGNMNRHQRTAHNTTTGGLLSSNSCTDSENSSDSEKPPSGQHMEEYNNNEIGKSNERDSPIKNRGSCKRKRTDREKEVSRKRRILMSGGDSRSDSTNETSGPYEDRAALLHKCPICGKEDFPTRTLLASHLESHHHQEAAVPVKCDYCALPFKNLRALNLHIRMLHYGVRVGPSAAPGPQDNSSTESSVRGLRSSVLGFNDLTFIDFSSDKFPAIAKAVCEQSIHRPLAGDVAKFQCSKCQRGFPCSVALDLHETECGNESSTTATIANATRAKQMDVAEDRSEDDVFFAGLNLRNKSIVLEASPRETGRDLADIPSILSVTSGPILQSFPRSDASTPDNLKANLANGGNFGQGPATSGSSNAAISQEEEPQDAFMFEFRRMKQKGEFPCRLCGMVFPNLRALKGHNGKAHMNVPPGTPYPCNMCPFSSLDKATVLKHLRNHNGDRPYECMMCNFSFTTKANCERHVRNRHGKIEREEVKSAMLYHPGRDSTNLDIETSPRLMKLDESSRKSLMYSSERDELSQPMHHYAASLSSLDAKGEVAGRFSDENHLLHNSSASSSILSLNLPAAEVLYRATTSRSLDSLQKHTDESNKSHESNARSDYSRLEDDDYRSRSSGEDAEEEGEEEEEEENAEEEDVGEEDAGEGEEEESSSLVNDTKADAHQRTQASPMNLKKPLNASSSSSHSYSTEEAPLDLSMDVLDLSKKSRDAAGREIADKNAVKQQQQQNNCANIQNELYNATNQLLLTQALLKAGQNNTQAATSLESLYANAHLLYRNLGTFPSGVASGILPPYLFNPHVFAQDFSMKNRIEKELVRGLQLSSGGSLVEPTLSSTAGYAFAANRDIAASQAVNDHQTYSQMMATAKLNSGKVGVTRDKTTVNSNAPPSNSVKMVIKNGVLMPKQKQRRYRTERPFTCEHCSARFTLRSNMERHIKQQHPQHWSQRPRGGHSTRGRPPANHSAIHNLGQNMAANILPKVEHNQEPAKHSISDQVKYAILAQQLKANKTEEMDSEEELVIDEEPSNLYQLKDQSTMDDGPKLHDRHKSLLRGQLEAAEAPSVDAVPQVKREVGDRQTSGDTADEGEKFLRDDSGESSAEPKVKDERGDERSKNVDPVQNRNEDNTVDLASVSELLDNASQQYQQFQPQYLSDEEGLVASASDNSESDEKSDTNFSGPGKTAKKMIRRRKKKSAYSLAPNRVICPYCERPFPWTSSLRRHILTHTGQKPFRCMYCNLLFTTKSNCDRHLLRKHKTNPVKARQIRDSASPEGQGPQGAQGQRLVRSNNAFSIRNVPERPYKCNQCPSSTFSTLGNLKKHRTAKHLKKANNKKKSSRRPESSAGSAPESPKQSDCESQSSGVSECNNMENNHQLVLLAQTQAQVPTKNVAAAGNTGTSNHQQQQDIARGKRPSPRSSPSPNDVPFKCHLCDSGFPERQDCLEHIKENHEKSYEMLVAKGALDMDIDAPSDHRQSPSSNQHLSDADEKRGRFPDYSNRKVVCAFCMRRFWSAEDLRRHMRTHTGERPFSCDICCRRFTLKHSMLRHRKKHESIDSTMYVGTSGDEENSPTQPATITPRSQHHQAPSSILATANASNGRMQERISLPTVAPVATADAAPAGLLRFNPYDNLTSLTGNLAASMQHNNVNTETAETADNDLISNLLGIRDKSIIDKVLQASPDDAAKLLGVKESHE